MCTYNLKGEKYAQSVFVFVHIFRDASNALLPNLKLTTALRALELNGALSHCAVLPQDSIQNLVRLCADSLVALQCVYMCCLDIAVGLWGCMCGDLVIGERGMSAPVRDSRLSSVGVDIRAMAGLWRDLGMCPYRQAVLKKQVC
jgi:hypothetical protein